MHGTYRSTGEQDARGRIVRFAAPPLAPFPARRRRLRAALLGGCLIAGAGLALLPEPAGREAPPPRLAPPPAPAQKASDSNPVRAVPHVARPAPPAPVAPPRAVTAPAAPPPLAELPALAAEPAAPAATAPAEVAAPLPLAAPPAAQPLPAAMPRLAPDSSPPESLSDADELALLDILLLETPAPDVPDRDGSAPEAPPPAAAPAPAPRIAAPAAPATAAPSQPPPPPHPALTPAEIEQIAAVRDPDPAYVAQIALPDAPGATPAQRSAYLVEAPVELALVLGGERLGDVPIRMTGPAGFEIQLAGLLDILADRFPADEYAMLRGAAADAYVTVDQLRAAGIALRYDPVYDELSLSA